MLINKLFLKYIQHESYTTAPATLFYLSSVGLVVGERVGERVGEMVGDTVGPSVRRFTRSPVGDRVGERVGERVGPSVSMFTRSGVGDRVGAKVGSYWLGQFSRKVIELLPEWSPPL